MTFNSALSSLPIMAGSITGLCKALGVTRQTYYEWQRMGGMTPGAALRAGKLYGLDAVALCAERHVPELVALIDLAREYAR